MLPTKLPRAAARLSLRRAVRCLSTLSSNPHIYIHPNPNSTSSSPNSHILSLLPTTPPTPSLSIGTTTKLPPTPDSLTENPIFLRHLHATLRRYAPEDKFIQGQAAAFASTSGSALGSGGMFSPQQQQQSKRRTARVGADRDGGDGAGGASKQGGAGGAGRGGWVHVSDLRAPPDYGRIAWPEDIFGSLEVDGRGEFVSGAEGDLEGKGDVGRYQESGTYRIITREGILGLSDFLRGKLVERLIEEEKKMSH